MHNGRLRSNYMQIFEPERYLGMYPKIWNKIERIYVRRIGEKMDEFFKDALKENYEKFRKYIMCSNAMVTGSIILQHALGERWPGHKWNRLDIDIFLAVKPISDDNFDWRISQTEGYTFYNQEYKFKLKHTNLHKLLYKIKDKEYNGGGYVTHSQYHDEFGKNVLLRINEYMIQKRNVFQVVEINKKKFSSWEEFIDKTVDFDICKNFFQYNDGDDFTLKICDLWVIIRKEAIFSFIHDRKSSLERKTKYEDRGFVFS